MLFSVIYEVETSHDVCLEPFKPPHARSLWSLTEGDNQRNFDYLCTCDEDELHESRKGRFNYLPFGRCHCGWRKSKHRKWCAVLTSKQFREFVRECNLCAQDIQTMGSMGAPGVDSFIAPAIAFENEEEDQNIISAYVTPILDKLAKHRQKRQKDPVFTDQDWQRIRKAIISAYE